MTEINKVIKEPEKKIFILKDIEYEKYSHERERLNSFVL